MPKKEVRIVTPVEDAVDATLLELLSTHEIRVTQVATSGGPPSLESSFEAAVAIPETLVKIVEAEREGADAVIIDCARDPGLEAARELVSIPVVGSAEATMHLAAILGHRFSILSVLDRLTPTFELKAKAFGLSAKLASVRTIGIPVVHLASNPNAVLEALVRESSKAIQEDDAHVLMFGCTGLTGYAAKVHDKLTELGFLEIPILDPLPVAVRLAQLLLQLGLAHSKYTYPSPGWVWSRL